MAGIVGFIDKNSEGKGHISVLSKMGDSLIHRGASEAYFTYPNCAFLARFNKNKSAICKKHYLGEEFVVLFDGEIFNKKQLYKNLSKKGFNTLLISGDHDLFLYYYLVFGVKGIAEIDGLFACAIHFRQEKKLCIFKDKVGIRPLYYYNSNGVFAFASEIKALFKNPKIAPEVDQNGIRKAFLLGPGMPYGETIYRGVEELEGGYILELRSNKITKQQYWGLSITEESYTIKTAAEKIKHLLTEATEKRITCSSIPASFLSGGLDSSIISAIAANKLKHFPSALSSYSIDFIGNDKNFISSKFQPTQDSTFARLAAGHISSSHNEINIKTHDLFKHLENAVIARDLPFMGDIDASLFIAAKEISTDEGKIFSGECADELFGGYPWYQDERLLSLNTFPWSYSLEFRKSVVKKEVLGNTPEDFVNDYYNKTILETPRISTDTEYEFLQRRMLLLNYKWFMRGLINRMERMGAANGVEIIAPFADPLVVEFAFNLPFSIKNHKNKEKGILRKAFSNLLPKEITNRKKSPFPKTFDPLYFSLVKNGVRKMLKNKKSPLYGMLNHSTINKLLEVKNPLSAPPWYGQLMRLEQFFAYLIGLEYLLNFYEINL